MSHHKKHPHDQATPAEQPPAEPIEGVVPEAGVPAAPASDEMTRLRAERDDYLARLQRVSADFVNYQKRASREMADIRETANADLLRNILPILDDMERATEAAGRRLAKDDAFLEGINMVHRKALEILSRYGLAPIESQGKPFDPVQHRAVSQIPTKDLPPNTVMQELQRGYALNGRTIRPATVVVSAGPVEEPQQEQQDQE